MCVSVCVFAYVLSSHSCFVLKQLQQPHHMQKIAYRSSPPSQLSAILQFLPSSHPLGLGGSDSDALFQAKHAAVGFVHHLTTSLYSKRGALGEGLINFNAPRHSPVPDHDLYSQPASWPPLWTSPGCQVLPPVTPAAVADTQNKELQTILFVSYYFGGGLQPSTHWFVSWRFFFVLRIQFPTFTFHVAQNPGRRAKTPEPSLRQSPLQSGYPLQSSTSVHPAQPTGLSWLKGLT